MWDMPRAATKVNIVLHEQGSDDSGKSGRGTVWNDGTGSRCRLQTCQRMLARPSLWLRAFSL